jgi:hypothetical protein
MNRELKLYARIDETQDHFMDRCRAAAAARADEDVAKLRDKFTARRDRVEKQQRAAEDRVRELDVDAKQRLQQEIVAGAGQLLSVFLGGRGSARSLSGVASRRGTTRRTQERLDSAKNKADSIAEELRRIEDDLADEIGSITDRWDTAASTVETRSIGLRQKDVTVDEVVLLWVPVPR